MDSILGIDPSDPLDFDNFSLTFLIFAIPAGLIGSKIGAKDYINRNYRHIGNLYTFNICTGYFGY